MHRSSHPVLSHAHERLLHPWFRSGSEHVETRPYTLRRGLFVLGQGIRRVPGVFAVAVVGSALYGVMTAGTAWALGKVTAEVITPAFSSGQIDGSELAAGAGLMA